MLITHSFGPTRWEADVASQNRDAQTDALGDAWINKVGEQQVGGTYRTQAEAIAAGKQLAM